MSSNFRTLTANGINIEVWEQARPSAEYEARSLAGRLSRGGEIDDGTIRYIDAPIRAGGKLEVWLKGDGFSMFEIPDGYEVVSVSSFDTSGACITMQKAD